MGRGRLRGVVLSLLTALLTVVAHALSGGGLPDVSLMAVLLPLLSAAFIAVADRVRGSVSTVVVLGAGQLVLHTCLTALHPTSHAAASPTALPTSLGGASSMFAAHALITLVTAVALRHADAAVAVVAAVLRRIVPRRIPPPVADRPLPTRPVPAPDLPARLARLFTVVAVRRGPPVWA